MAETLGLWRPPQVTAVLFVFNCFSYVATPPPLLGMFTQAPLPGAGLAAAFLGRQRGRDFGALVTILLITSSLFLGGKRLAPPDAGLPSSVPCGLLCPPGRGLLAEEGSRWVRVGSDYFPKPGSLGLVPGQNAGKLGSESLSPTCQSSFLWPPHTVTLTHHTSHAILSGPGKVGRAVAPAPGPGSMKPKARVLGSRAPGGGHVCFRALSSHAPPLPAGT